MKKERTSNKVTIFTAIGATGHSAYERADGDFYATDPRAVDALAHAGKLPKSPRIWECAAGQGHLSEALKLHGFEVVSTDLHDRGYCEGGTDFLQTEKLLAPCIFTNPPFRYVTDFCIHANELGAEEVYMFLRLTFLEGKRRYRDLYSIYPPSEILQFVERVPTARNGDFLRFTSNSAVPFCWMIWRKGYTGSPRVGWISAKKNGATARPLPEAA